MVTTGENTQCGMAAQRNRLGGPHSGKRGSRLVIHGPELESARDLTNSFAPNAA
jgi:hypothetical protein